MPTRRFERRIALAQILVGGCALAFSACVLIEHAQAQPGYCASPDTAAAARSQSIHSQYRASTELQTHKTFNTKHNTFNTKQRSK